MKKHIGKLAALAVVALAASTGLASNAQAGSGAWANQTGGPTLYQSNWYYYSSYISQPSGIPSTAIVSNLRYSAGMSYYPSGLNVGVCPSDAGGGCYWTTSASGTIYPSDNRKANQAFRFGFYVARYTTQMLTPYVYGGVDQVIVNYNY